MPRDRKDHDVHNPVRDNSCKEHWEIVVAFPRLAIERRPNLGDRIAFEQRCKEEGYAPHDDHHTEDPDRFMEYLISKDAVVEKQNR